MEKFYLIINNHLDLKDNNQPISKDNPIKDQSLQPQPQPRLNKIKEQYNPSPKTIRRNISKENFMKYQWAWTL